ncbi:MAG: hypothetical protein GWN01_12170 [Nitrosopumilaceae archaeon]|nr:hypothetical protein [Nitrosopumilaceae archaeon]NIU88050.1 hypothetical protein [Nitrosopumilaceae archaeon]NIX62234.1 hypothetical protein [Nitrosopumilaceae archaeon]
MIYTVITDSNHKFNVKANNIKIGMKKAWAFSIVLGFDNLTIYSENCKESNKSLPFLTASAGTYKQYAYNPNTNKKVLNLLINNK